MSVTKHVNLQTYRNNLKVITEKMAPSKVMAVIKADGYGHGLVETARAATEAGIEILGVLDIESGLAIRKAGISTPAFAWLHSLTSDFAAAVMSGIELSAGSNDELVAIAATPGRARVHLKIDTGLSRNGCRPELWDSFVRQAMEFHVQKEIEVVAIWSHLSGTSNADDEAAIEVFELATIQARNHDFDGYRHIASSPAAFLLAQSRYDLVRIGVSAFGTSPIEGISAKELGLGAPMTVTAEVLSPGLISIGYLHGYFSQLSGKSRVSINEKPYRILKVGPLASQIEAGDYEAGTEVLVFGSEPDFLESAEDLCRYVDTVTDELFTGLKTNLSSYTN